MKNVKDRLKESQLFMRIHDTIIKPISLRLGIGCHKKVNGKELDLLRDEICLSADEIINQAKKTRRIIKTFTSKYELEIVINNKEIKEE